MIFTTSVSYSRANASDGGLFLRNNKGICKVVIYMLVWLSSGII